MALEPVDIPVVGDSPTYRQAAPSLLLEAATQIAQNAQRWHGVPIPLVLVGAGTWATERLHSLLPWLQGEVHMIVHDHGDGRVELDMAGITPEGLEIVAEAKALGYSRALEGDRLNRSAEDLSAAQSFTDSAYAERNKLVHAMTSFAAMFGWPCGLAKHVPEDGEEWGAEWLNLIFIDLPTGQVSWHIHAREIPLFSHLPLYEGSWDGHTTDEKYARLAALEHWRAP